jgi:hypothetical protein
MLSVKTAQDLLKWEERVDEASDDHGEDSDQAKHAQRMLESARRQALIEVLHKLAVQTLHGGKFDG